MPLPRTTTADALQIRRLYEAGGLSRADAISGLVALGFTPGAAAATFRDAERAHAEAAAGILVNAPALRPVSAEPRYPTNTPVGAADTLSQRVDDLIRFLKARVMRHASARNLLVYDGSVFDQLVYTLASSVLPPDRYDVVCPLRPCMDKALQEEVRNFATQRGYQLLEYSGSCEMDFAKLQMASARCSNVTSSMASFFEGGEGTCFVGSASTDDHLLEMRGITEFYGRSILKHDESTGDVVWETLAARGHNWRTVLLLHGMMPYEIVACAMAFGGASPQPWHVPECYLPCYFELEKRRVRAVIERSSEALSQALSEPSES